VERLSTVFGCKVAGKRTVLML